MNCDNKFLEIFEYQDFKAMIIRNFLVKFSSTRVRFSIEHSIDEIKPVVSEKVSLNEDILQHWWNFSEISDYEDCDQRHKTTDFSKGSLLQVEQF